MTDNFAARLEAIMRRRHPEYTFVVEIRQHNLDVRPGNTTTTVRMDETGTVTDHPDTILNRDSPTPPTRTPHDNSLNKAA